MVERIDPNFIEAVELIKKRLRSFVCPEFVEGLYDRSNPIPLNVAVFEALKMIKQDRVIPSDGPWPRVSTDYGAFTNEPIDFRAHPPSFCDTYSLAKAVQDLIAENLADGVGFQRGSYTGLSLQTLFLLDLQRYLARRNVPRAERLIRASGRRASLAATNGPVETLKSKIEREVNSV